MWLPLLMHLCVHICSSQAISMGGSSRAAPWSDWSWSVAEISPGLVFLSCFPHPRSYKCIPQERYFHKDLSLVLLLGREADQWQPVSEAILGGSPCSGIVDQGCLRARRSASLLAGGAPAFLECLHSAMAEMFTLENGHGAQMEGDARTTSHTWERLGTIRKAELGGRC